MNSPRSPKFSDYNSFSNPNGPQDSSFNRRVPSEIYDQRMKSYNQLSNFYLPYLNKIYEANRQSTPYLKPPEELLFNSRLFQMRQNEVKKRLETVQKDNEVKQQKIKQLNSKVVQLLQRLRVHEPTGSYDIQLPFNGFTEAERDLKRVENLLRIKNEETLFSIKMKAMSLLEQFGVDRSDIEGMHQIETENGVFEFINNRLKGRIKDYRHQSISKSEESEKEKIIQFKLEEEIKFLSDSNEMIRNSERKLKEKYEEIKKQWSHSNERLIAKEKENEQMDIELFRLRKLLEEKESLLIKYNSKMHNNTALADEVRGDYDLQVKDLRRLLSSYSAQITELKQQLEWKEGEHEELKIDYNLKIHQHEKVHREYVRWKDRYDNFQKEKLGSHEDTTRYIEINRQLEEQNHRLKHQLTTLHLSQPISPVEIFDSRGHDKIIEKLRNQVIYKSQEVDTLTSRVDALEKEKRNREVETQDSSMVIQRKYDRMLKEMEALYKTNKVRIHEDWQEAYNQLKQKFERENKELKQECNRLKKYELVRRGEQGPFNYRTNLDRDISP